ncbi:MAG: alkaline phosphatase family protein [Gemmatimonadota bacterium]|nr:alkaline phosphatase family protein [Gemmatimonadota bacterium]
MPYEKVVVIGLDGLEPKIVEPMLANGELPNLAKLRASGGYSRCRTTFPAQTPVAWSSFATGVNPGGHGIYDFIRRDPRTYLPDLALNRYEQKSAFLPPTAVNLRHGTPVWELLTNAGVSSVVHRCPCTYPPDDIKGRMLSGMGVPDLRGGLGTATFYSSGEGVKAGESETVVPLKPDGRGVAKTVLIGPRDPKSGSDAQLEMTIEIDRAARKVTIKTDGKPKHLVVREAAWSDWLCIKFRMGMLQSVSGMVRFFLVRTEPVLELYASPINFDPASPMFPISHPWDYAAELARETGTFYTTGMVEDHGGLSNLRFDEGAYLDQCTQVLRERERMMLHELDRLDEGFFFTLFDTPDRLQHMFWRFREPDHPANNGDGTRDAEWSRAIEQHYQECDAIVGRAMERADDRTLFVVLSDHGFNSFQRGVHLNTWLHDNGFLALESGRAPTEEAGNFFKDVDWGRTKAYALGLGSLYLNLQGREAQGIVTASDADGVTRDVVAGLTGLRDVARGAVAVQGVVTRDQVYSGAYVAEAPDMVVNFAAGYRVSWATALGGLPHGHFEDNVERWGGDHIIDPALVPGVLFMNRPFAGERVSLLDLAPTVLSALGVPKGKAMEGAALI